MQPSDGTDAGSGVHVVAEEFDQRLAEQLLTAAAAITVGSIEISDARLSGLDNEAHGVLVAAGLVKALAAAAGQNGDALAVFPNWRVGSRDSAPERDPLMPATATVLCRNSRREVLISAPCLERAYHRAILVGTRAPSPGPRCLFLHPAAEILPNRNADVH